MIERTTTDLREDALINSAKHHKLWKQYLNPESAYFPSSLTQTSKMTDQHKCLQHQLF